MPGGGKKKHAKFQETKEPPNPEEQKEANANTDGEDGDSEGPHEATTLYEGIQNISRQITDLRTELKADLNSFKNRPTT
ncbi:unnamed protein product [Knipowitschia caucasica]